MLLYTAKSKQSFLLDACAFEIRNANLFEKHTDAHETKPNARVSVKFEYLQEAITQRGQ